MMLRLFLLPFLIFFLLFLNFVVVVFFCMSIPHNHKKLQQDRVRRSFWTIYCHVCKTLNFINNAFLYGKKYLYTCLEDKMLLIITPHLLDGESKLMLNFYEDKRIDCLVLISITVLICNLIMLRKNFFMFPK